MSQTRTRFRYLWIVVIILVGLVTCKRLFEYQTKSFIPSLPFVAGLERSWSLTKQRVSLLPLSAELPQIFEPRFQRTANFWRDQELHKKLIEFIDAYPGPVILNIDAQMISETPRLSRLLNLSNVIRNIAVGISGEVPGPELESLLKKISLARPVNEKPRLGEQTRISPTRSAYYLTGLEKGAHFGVVNYQVDEASIASLFIGSFPLSVSTLDFELPGLVLAALKAKDVCARWAQRYDSSLFIYCSEPLEEPLSDRDFLNPQPLQFYASALPRKDSIDKLEKSNRLLIVNPVDSSSAFPSPTGERFTWSDLFVTSYLNLRDGKSPVYSWTSVGLEVFFLLSLVLAFVVFVRHRRLNTVIALSVCEIILFIAGDFLMSQVGGFFTQPIESFVALVFVFSVGSTQRLIQESDERKILERAFSGYVSAERLERLVSGQEKLELDGHLRELSFLMLDISQFSKISRELSAKDTFHFMQRFFSVVDEGVLNHEGVIDKKTGDGLLAFFGDYVEGDDPQKAARTAVNSALHIQSLLTEHRLGVNVRIGVNSGSAVIGNAGSKKHFNYTVLGDAVNFTQRLEAACPRGKVLVGPETAKLCENWFHFEEFWIEVKNEEKKYQAFMVTPNSANSTTAI